MGMAISGLATLTRDAEARKTDKGTWLNFGVASRRKGVDEGRQDTDFFEGVYYVKGDESKLLANLKKGTHIYIDRAEMRADKYEKDGQPRTAYKIRIFDFDFIGRMVEVSREKEKQASTPEAAPVAMKPAPPKTAKTSAPPKEELYYEDEIPEDSPPF